MDDLINLVSYPVYLFFLIASIFSFVVGVGLASRSKGMLRFIGVMNRWVSVRRVAKPLAIPHHIEPVLLKRPMLLGSIIILGAGVSVYVLSNLGSEGFRPLLPGSPTSASTIILADSVKWLLLTGNVFCILAGIMMLFYPKRLAALETSMDHWYSTRNVALPLETVHMEFDNWILSHPTSSGITLSILSLSYGISMLAHL